MKLRRSHAWWAALLALLVILLVVGFFVSRSRTEVVATLRGSAGQVARDHRTTIGAWEVAKVGATFALGDGIRTGAASTATLELAGAHKLSLEPSTLIRFLARPSDKGHARVALESGEVTLEAADDPLELETSLGVLHVQAHGRARLDKDRLEVTIGSAEIDRDGKRWELRVGDAVEVTTDPNQPLKPVPPGAPTGGPSATALPPSAPSESTGAPPADGGAEPPLAAGSFEHGLDRVDLTISPGDSLVIHDPHPPTAVGVASGHCSGSALLTVDPGSRAKKRVGETRVGVELGGGAHHYFIQCLNADGAPGERVGQGAIAVIADAGLRQLAKTAPVTNLDVDGRHYTVLYQSLLPKISVHWPSAPAAASYSLSVSSPDGTKTVSTGSPSYSFGSGALTEGEHLLSFQAGGARSRQTSVVVRFDNAAPTASITSPADQSFAAGSPVHVSGMAQPGWVVTVGGQTLAQDAQNRFAADVGSPADQALAIRFTHPGRGVHYYLRRSVAQ
jgi:hypothetical protein